MKRVFALILALCMACALFACGKKQTEVAPGGDSPTVTPGATDPGSGPAENPGGSTGVPGGAGSTGNAGNGGNTTGSTGSGWAGTRVAVIYFSCTGSTRTAAERIRDMTGADLYELTPEQPYTSQDLSYNNDACRASQEQKDPAARPRIAGQPLDLSQYGTIYLGYPIWWGTAPRIINTFLDTYDLTGKTIRPFCTSGSSGISTSVNEARSLCADATIIGRTLLLTSSSLSQMATRVPLWLEEIGANREETESPGETSMKVKISVGNRIITATMEDNAAGRDFLSRLPLEVTLNDYNNTTEKIFYPDPVLTTEGVTRGCAPTPGNITIYAPWGNVAIFCKSRSHSDDLIKIGRIDGDGIEALNIGGDIAVKFERQ